MSDVLAFHFVIDGNDFTSAGQASVQVKRNLRQLGLDSETIRRVSVAMYEGEINKVLGHCDVGCASARVDNHVDLSLVHSDRNASYSLRIKTKLSKISLHLH